MSAVVFHDFDRLLNEALGIHSEAARLVIDHCGEKGRALEGIVKEMLRTFLPGEYGIGTGFIAYVEKVDTSAEQAVPSPARVSSQLDIIIYDRVRCAPLVRVPTCEVYPLEAVFAHVEVKANLRIHGDGEGRPSGDSIESCIENSRKLNSITLTPRRFWAPVAGTATSVTLEERAAIQARSYVFAFHSEHGEGALGQRIADCLAKVGAPAHLHGIFVGNRGYYETHAAENHQDPNMYSVRYYKQEKALSAFITALIEGLQRYPRFPVGWAPALDLYRVSGNAAATYIPKSREPDATQGTPAKSSPPGSRSSAASGTP